MATKVDICNGALTKVGASPINSLDDKTKSANVCKLRYDIVRKTVLRLHIWKCCKTRVKLSPKTGKPAFGWDFWYELPSDVLRVFMIYDDNLDQIRSFEKEGNLILTDYDTSINVTYIKDEEDTNKFDDLLVEAMATYLAVDISYTLVQDSGLRQELRSLQTEILLKAKSVDAKEDYPKVIQANSWVNNSRSGSGIQRKYPHLQ